MADEIINARVKQKVDTEDNWLLNDLILLEGEQGFVVDELGEPVNFKIGDGTKTFAELPYWITYYSNVISHKLIRLNNISTPTAVLSIFRQNTNLYDVLITNNGGADFVLKIGTSEGGSEIGEFPIDQDLTAINISELFSSAQNVYLSGFDGNSISAILVYFDYDESPVIPPSDVEPTAFRYPKGHLGYFYPVGEGHLVQCFDLVTGLGIAGTPYENCAWCDGRNNTPDMRDAYPIGYKTGVTLGNQVGNTSNSKVLTQANLPNVTLGVSLRSIYQQRGNTGSRYNFLVLEGDTERIYGVPLGGNNQPIDMRPNSRYILPFLAITD